MNRIDLTNNLRVHTQNRTSKGDQPKWQSGDSWYKADNMGYEALSEVLISNLLVKSNVSEFVCYHPVMIDLGQEELVGCKSINFCKGDEILVPFEKFHRMFAGMGLAKKLTSFSDAAEKIKYTVDFVEHHTGLSNVGEYLTMLLELDAVFLNEDRHTNNLAVLANDKTEEFRLCPVFDNGLALLSDLHDYLVNGDVYQMIKRVQAKPFATDFMEQIEAANSLYGSVLKLFFEKKDVKAILETLEGYYPIEILKRVEQILFEQMRRYQAYFF